MSMCRVLCPTQCTFYVGDFCGPKGVFYGISHVLYVFEFLVVV